jgi:hypothetical protein
MTPSSFHDKARQKLHLIQDIFMKEIWVQKMAEFFYSFW